MYMHGRARAGPHGTVTDQFVESEAQAQARMIRTRTRQFEINFDFPEPKAWTRAQAAAGSCIGGRSQPDRALSLMAWSIAIIDITIDDRELAIGPIILQTV